MRNPTRAFVALLAVMQLAAAGTAQKDPPDVEPSLKAPRGDALEWKSAQGRPYWYRLPKQIDAKNPPALLIMLHGTGGSQGWSFWNYPIVGGDFRKQDIIVSPDGVTPGEGGTFNFVQGQKDGEQIAGLIADFKKRFPIGRVYLYGHSQGAFFVYWFAGEHPELIDGIVAHAGNVLGDVKHGKLGKQKVAIAILHGRADAVVPVDCAIRTEKVYRDEGYTKLKLEIVDGLNAQSGHWPLPFHVSKLLDWCDQVSAASATQCVQTIASELQKKAPDLAVVAEQLKKARALLPKAEDMDKKNLPPQLDAVQTFLDTACELHAQALLADSGVQNAKPAPGAWVAHFVAVDRAFADNAAWKKSVAKLRELAKAHDKITDKAVKPLDKNTKETRAAALKALEDGFLSPSFEELRTLLEQACTSSKPPDDDCKQKLAALVASRKTFADQASKTIAGLQESPIGDLKKNAPELFAGGDGEAGK